MKKSLLQCSLIGALIGYSIFHPLVMLLSYLMSSNAVIFDTSKSFGIMDVIKKSFSAGMLPWSLSFAFFNGIIGLYYGSIKQANLAQKKLIADLQKALADVKKLSGMLPICSSCKKIRNDEGYWQQIEEYIRDHSEADFTHGICEGCVKELYPEHYQKFKERMDKMDAVP
jgi:hypothetical protein